MENKKKLYAVVTSYNDIVWGNSTYNSKDEQASLFWTKEGAETALAGLLDLYPYNATAYRIEEVNVEITATRAEPLFINAQ